MNEVCNACAIEIMGCACDGSLDDGCFLCTPRSHDRPPCPPSCKNFTSKGPSKPELDTLI